jgi:hypothetical protein
MYDEWPLARLHRELAQATSLSIARFGTLLELRLRTPHCDLRYRTRFFW